MIDNEKLLKELERRFKKIKDDLDFSANLDEIDKHFFIKDFIIEKRFVSEDFSNQLRIRIIDMFVNWDNYLHSLVMPNPQNLFNLNESKAFGEEDKKEIMKVMSRVAHLVSRNNLVRLTRDRLEEAKIIDDSLRFWNEVYHPFFVKILSKIEEHWQEISEKKSKI